MLGSVILFVLFVTLTERLGREYWVLSVQNVKKLVKIVKIGLDNLVNVYYNRSITRKMTVLR